MRLLLRVSNHTGEVEGAALLHVNLKILMRIKIIKIITNSEVEGAALLDVNLLTFFVALSNSDMIRYDKITFGQLRSQVFK